MLKKLKPAKTDAGTRKKGRTMLDQQLSLLKEKKTVPQCACIASTQTNVILALYVMRRFSVMQSDQIILVKHPQTRNL